MRDHIYEKAEQTRDNPWRDLFRDNLMRLEDAVEISGLDAGSPVLLVIKLMRLEYEKLLQSEETV